jgi:hypothetical protein
MARSAGGIQTEAPTIIVKQEFHSRWRCKEHILVFRTRGKVFQK